MPMMREDWFAYRALFNCEYHVYKRRVFIRALRDIAAGSELFVPYGSEYWQVIRHNIKEDLKVTKSSGKKPRLPHQDVGSKKPGTKKKK